jgi:hypothetical protein
MRNKNSKTGVIKIALRVSILSLLGVASANAQTLDTLCFRERTIQTPTYLAPRYLAAGATTGACAPKTAAYHISEVFIPGKQFSRCEKTSAYLYCPLSDNEMPEANINIPLERGRLSDAQLKTSCRAAMLAQLKQLNCTDDFTSSDNCSVNAADLASAKARYFSEKPWQFASVSGQREKQGITKISASELLSHNTTEYREVNAMAFSNISQADPCDNSSGGKSFSYPVFQIESKSILKEATLNPNFTKPDSQDLGIVNVDQTIIGYYLTPVDKAQAASFNELQVCSNETPWVANTTKDITSKITFNGQPIRDETCNFAAVHPIGTVLYDIARGGLLSGKQTITPGSLDDESDITKIENRPKELDAFAIFTADGLHLLVSDIGDVRIREDSF